jgi:hypothetical protein
MGFLAKVTGYTKKIRPHWVGAVHDARCHFGDISFDSTVGALSIRCWQLDASVWKELLVVFEGLRCPPTISREEELPYYELSTVYFDPDAKRVHICFHAGLSIEYSADQPRYSFRGPTGQTQREKFV